MAKAGAKLKLTKKVAETICDAIQIGTSLRAAAVYGGVSYRTFLYWVQMGQEEAERLEALIEGGEEEPQPLPNKERYLQFFHQVEEAKADAIVGWTNTLSKAAEVNPEWARYMLSKWSTDLHGDQPQRLELTGKDGGAIKHEDAAITDEERLARIMALADRARERRDRGGASGDSGTEELTD